MPVPGAKHAKNKTGYKGHHADRQSGRTEDIQCLQISPSCRSTLQATAMYKGK